MEALKTELQKRLDSQILELKMTLPADSTALDVECEVFGNCDHLQKLIVEKNIDQKDNDLSVLRQSQHYAVNEVLDFLEQSNDEALAIYDAGIQKLLAGANEAFGLRA